MRVVVTGGSGGIGSAIVSSFLEEGAHVVNLDLRTAEPSTERGRLETVVVDLGDAEGVRAAFATVDESFGGAAPDTLVCCASISKEHDALDVDLDDFDRIIDVNVRGTFLVCQETGRRMRDAGRGGHIVVITSICDSVAWAGEPVYTISKGAQWSLVQSLAIELAPHGIAVNAVAPFAIEVASAGMASTRANDGVRAGMLARTPTGRFGRPEEIAEAVRYLARAGWVTGQRVVVDGGFLATGLAYPAQGPASMNGDAVELTV